MGEVDWYGITWLNIRSALDSDKRIELVCSDKLHASLGREIGDDFSGVRDTRLI